MPDFRPPYDPSPTPYQEALTQDTADQAETLTRNALQRNDAALMAKAEEYQPPTGRTAVIGPDGKRYTVPDDRLQDAITQGGAKPEADRRFFVRAPDGKKYSVPGTHLQAAIAQGGATLITRSDAAAEDYASTIPKEQRNVYRSPEPGVAGAQDRPQALLPEMVRGLEGAGGSLSPEQQAALHKEADYRRIVGGPAGTAFAAANAFAGGVPGMVARGWAGAGPLGVSGILPSTGSKAAEDVSHYVGATGEMSPNATLGGEIASMTELGPLGAIAGPVARGVEGATAKALAPVWDQIVPRARQAIAKFAGEAAGAGTIAAGQAPAHLSLVQEPLGIEALLSELKSGLIFAATAGGIGAAIGAAAKPPWEAPRSLSDWAREASAAKTVDKISAAHDELGSLMERKGSQVDELPGVAPHRQRYLDAVEARDAAAEEYQKAQQATGAKLQQIRTSEADQPLVHLRLKAIEARDEALAQLMPSYTREHVAHPPTFIGTPRYASPEAGINWEAGTHDPEEVLGPSMAGTRHLAAEQQAARDRTLGETDTLGLGGEATPDPTLPEGKPSPFGPASATDARLLPPDQLVQWAMRKAGTGLRRLEGIVEQATGAVGSIPEAIDRSQQIASELRKFVKQMAGPMEGAPLDHVERLTWKANALSVSNGVERKLRDLIAADDWVKRTEAMQSAGTGSSEELARRYNVGPWPIPGMNDTAAGMPTVLQREHGAWGASQAAERQAGAARQAYAQARVEGAQGMQARSAAQAQGLAPGAELGQGLGDYGLRGQAPSGSTPEMAPPGTALGGGFSFDPSAPGGIQRFPNAGKTAAPPAVPGKVSSTLGFLAREAVGAASGAALGMSVHHSMLGGLIGTAVGGVSPQVAMFMRRMGPRMGRLLASPTAFAANFRAQLAKDIGSAISGVSEAAGKAAGGASSLAGSISEIRFDGLRETAPRTLGAMVADRSQQLAALAADPATTEQRVSHALAPLRAIDEDAASIAAAWVLKKIQYLSQYMPKNPSPPTPFREGPDWEPSPTAATAAALRLRAAEDPIGALTAELRSGQVTNETLQTVQALRPELWQTVRQQIAQSMMAHGQTLPYERRVALTRVLGIPIEPTMTPAFMQAIQQMHSTSADQSANAPGPRGGYMVPKRKIKLSEQRGTSAQRLGE